MAKVNSSVFADEANRIHSKYTVTYKNGKNGEKINGQWQCDCRGYVIWALRNLGISISSPGTNWMIRNQMTSVEKLTSKSQLEKGMVVFKSCEKNSANWNLPDKYRSGKSAYNATIGQIDVYHVGIVVQTSPSLIIRHCSGGGLMTDTKLGNWCWCGWVQWVAPDVQNVAQPAIPDEPYIQDMPELQPTQEIIEEVVDGFVNNETAIVTVDKLNLRKSPSTKAPRVQYMNTGDQVVILKAKCGTEGWVFVKYNKWTGYVMSKFLKKG